MTKKPVAQKPAPKLSNGFVFDPQEEGTVLIWQNYTRVQDNGASGTLIGTITGNDVTWRVEKVPAAIKRYADAIGRDGLGVNHDLLRAFKNLVDACDKLPATDGRVIGLLPLIARARIAIEKASN